MVLEVQEKINDHSEGNDTKGKEGADECVGCEREKERESVRDGSR